jgi:hypothetical protein
MFGGRKWAIISGTARFPCIHTNRVATWTKMKVNSKLFVTLFLDCFMLSKREDFDKNMLFFEICGNI